MIILLKHYSKTYYLTHIKKKRYLLSLLFLFYTSGLFAINYSYDNNYSIYSSGLVDIKSNKLSLNTFDNKWESIPDHKEDNYINGKLYYDLYFTTKDIQIGLFNKRELELYINDGFIQTWANANNDFKTLLLKNNIGDDIDYVNIKGDINYYLASGLYIKKKYSIHNHILSIRLNLLRATDLEFIKVSGSNSNEEFLLDIDTFYSKKNLITKNDNLEDSYAYGHSIDINYKYLKNNFIFDLNIYNLYSYIYWKDVAFMHYTFNSNTVYIGDDGYKHNRAFGVGYYKYNQKYTQKISPFIKTKLNYKLSQNTYIGDLFDIYKNFYTNELFITQKYSIFNFKLAYILENKIALFGFGTNNYNIEISNKFSTSNTVLKLNYKIKLW